MSDEKYSDYIEAAEKRILIFSWIGTVASLSLIAYAIFI